MPQTHFEPYLYLAGLTHDSALIAWGGFYFSARDRGSAWQIVDDERLPSRQETIGLSSEPYGRARVVVHDEAGNRVAERTVRDENHVCIEGLEPERRYRYTVFVDDKQWAAGERHDWCQDESTGEELLCPSGRVYDNTFRTHPSPDAPASALDFALIGDYGVGIRGSSDAARRQRQVGRALEHAVDSHGVRILLTAGDNIYLPHERGTDQGSGDEDDDWFFTFYQPYRYVINRVPVYPTVGNHDSDETEASDDRSQLEDNFYLGPRFVREGEARSKDELGLYYRFAFGRDIEFVSVDTSHASRGQGCEHYFELPTHRQFLERAFQPPTHASAARWLIPFSHHPPYCAGPHHGNNEAMLAQLVPLFQRAGVRAVFSGHEHNFQYALDRDVHYFVSGAGAKLRAEPPTAFKAARTRAWAAEGHFLLVQIRGRQMAVTPVARVSDGRLEPVTLHSVGESVRSPIVITI
jgi:tartrate-resistant acid phosphatase type 5